MGAFVPSSGLDTLFIPRERSARPGKGRLALVSQSGAVSVAFMEKAEASGVGLHSSIGLGNKMDIDENDLTEYLASEDAVGCIALYLESFSDGRRFMRICRMASRKKPIVILKSGRTEAGSAAARSHTGAMSSQESVVEGALRQMGVVRVFDEEELLDVARALDYVDRIRGDRVCVVASAGGFGVIAADYIESDRHGAGLKMSKLSSQTTSALSDVVPKFSSVKNPVDLTAGVTDQMYDSVLGILERDRGIDCILMSLELQPPNVTDRLVRVAERWGRDGKTPLVVSVFAGPETGRVVQRFSKRRIPAFPSIWRAVRAIGALAERGSRIKILE